MKEGIIPEQYSLDLDRRRAMTVMAMRGASGFEEKLNYTRSFMAKQIHTELKERLGAAESTYVYEIKDGKLYGEGDTEPFEEVLKRGMYRRRVDFEREEAELVSFKMIQSVLASPQTPDGTTILNVSPRGQQGSNYEQNFADTFTRVGDKVITKRFRSNLSNSQYREKIVGLSPHHASLLSPNPTDVDLKLNPVIIPKSTGLSNPEDLIKYLLKEKVGVPEKEIDQLIMTITPVVTSYINTVLENPQALGLIEDSYLAVLNVAYDASQQEHPTDLYSLPSMQRAMARATHHNHEKENQPVGDIVGKFGLQKMEIVYLAQDPVKIGSGGCGAAGCSVGEQSSFDTGIKITDEYGKLEFNCPDCHRKNTRGLHQLITKCQYKDCESANVLPGSMAGKSPNSVRIS